MNDPHHKIKKNARICIVGAGPGGLSTAYYLKENGYTNVTILEKLPQVGGMCRTLTFEARSFDIGANYLTPAYKKIIAIANKLGLPLYTEKPSIAFDRDRRKWISSFQAAKGNTGLIRFLWAMIRYIYHRWRVGKKMPAAGHLGESKIPELMQSFGSWLRQYDLYDQLHRMFQVPITMMGYGDLDEIPAPYALLYMSLASFRTVILYGSGLPSCYPKRFIYGFQRFFDRLSWDLNIRTAVTIKKISRDVSKEDPVTVEFTYNEQFLEHEEITTEIQSFDHIIVTVPLYPGALSGLPLDYTSQEREIFKNVVINPFCLTGTLVNNFNVPAKIISIFPTLPPYLKEVAILGQQFSDNPFVSFYTRLPQTQSTWLLDVYTKEKDMNLEKEVYANVCSFIKIITPEATVAPTPYSFTVWQYFPHVNVDQFKEGFYDSLEAMQGANNTFWAGGLMSFDLICSIFDYSELLVKKHFIGSND